ncbi:hypothetical protein TWF481_010520 [Arthrobotrys musiformis]|uniref:Pyridoxal phosphate-dependent transferase n=1 Tax=Arthrobotrys musiformis TaxID=47236 RepID=A0AAV9W3D6_9PEZI
MQTAIPKQSIKICAEEAQTAVSSLELGGHLVPEVLKLKEAQIAVVTEEIDFSGSQSSESSAPQSPVPEVTSRDVIRNTFKAYKSQWIHDPVVSQWDDPNHGIHKILTEVNDLYQTWVATPPRPFSPFTDPLWADAGRTMAEIGLPWHNNQLNMPDEIDTSWPFHFKSYEQIVLREKGARVGDANATGYVCTAKEANCYCIRTIQQELRDKRPTLEPILVYDNFDEQTIFSAQSFFGLQVHRISLSNEIGNIIRDLKQVTKNERPVIFAATLASSSGKYDDLDTICNLADNVELLLHVDASRNFDYITTLSLAKRKQLGIKSLKLEPRLISQPLRARGGVVRASTIVAAGANHAHPPPAVALKPASLGTKHAKVAYVRAPDSALAGSRDALSPLWIALQEIRFGKLGFQRVYQHCSRMRTVLLRALEGKVSVAAPSYSLDVIVQSCSKEQIERLVALGGDVLANKEDVILTIQPSTTLHDIYSLVEAISHKMDAEKTISEDFSKEYPVPPHVVDDLRETVQSWKIRSRSATGYPLAMSSYSALGPVIGRFLNISILEKWLESQAHQLLVARMQRLGLVHSQDKFQGSFTTGSTMGNRVGIHVALARLPGAFVYFSSESHYSVPKTVKDCDTITNRWNTGRGPRYSEIPCDKMGCMLADALAEQALIDQKSCLKCGEDYHMVLFANMGTTFLGARDNLKEIYEKLQNVGIKISHIHVDGALDLGFENGGVKLGLPGTLTPEGVPLVQGVTISHHKALGNMVSGQIICYSPQSQLGAFKWDVDPRIVFEAWLYGRIFGPAEIRITHQYCQDNAARLERGLQKAGLATKRNPGSIIVIFERLPGWIIEEFSLRPEGDWVHFIAMPHISPATVDLLLGRISWFQKQCLAAFSYVSPMVESIMMRPITLKSVGCQSPLATSIIDQSASAIPLEQEVDSDIGDIVKSSMRGAVSVAVVDEEGQVTAALLIESNRNMSIKVGPLLVRACNVLHGIYMVDIAKQLAGLMARHMNVQLSTDSFSYKLYSI